MSLRHVQTITRMLLRKWGVSRSGVRRERDLSDLRVQQMQKRKAQTLSTGALSNPNYETDEPIEPDD